MPEEKKEEVVEETIELEEKEEDKEEEKEEVSEEEEELDIEKIIPETRRTKKEEAESEDEEEMDADDKKRISKIVQREVGNKMSELENKMEVQSFIQGRPEYAKYQAVMLKYMNHPDYANIPVQNIAAIVASKDLMKIGAKKEREAQKVVAETKNPGTTVRKTESSGVNWANVSKEEFEAQKARVLGRQGN